VVPPAGVLGSARRAEGTQDSAKKPSSPSALNCAEHFRYGLAVQSGTAALHSAMKALGVSCAKQMVVRCNAQRCNTVVRYNAATCNMVRCSMHQCNIPRCAVDPPAAAAARIKWRSSLPTGPRPVSERT
jgi:hypothetical protein